MLLHCCCGPCATEVVDHFRGLGCEVAGWSFNPNIHPEEERARRQRTLAEAARRMCLPLVEGDSGERGGEEMGLAQFLLALARREGRRCRACYELRLGATAREAAGRGFDAFSTTLLISPYQDTSALAKIGRQVGERHGVEFRFADLRGSYGESIERAREMGLYRQNYCGCQFSALERAERRAGRAIGKARARLARGREPEP